jgi:phosphatidylglycerophosphate synthase
VRLSSLPNAITISRMLAAPVLAALAFHQQEALFVGLFVAALISDVADGMLARALGCASATGALLDSLADILLVLATLAGIGSFHVEVFEQDGWLFAICFFLWALVNLAALARFRRLSSLHTSLARLGMAAFHVFVLVLYFVGYQAWMLYWVASLVSIGAVEQLAMVLLLPFWTPDLKNGIVELLRRRSAERKIFSHR